MPADYLLYAAQPSYFSAKVRACFQYKRPAEVATREAQLPAPPRGSLTGTTVVAAPAGTTTRDRAFLADS